MKKMRKLIPALAMLLVSAVMMSTASFAWFSMNQDVTATGISVKATSGGGLVIAVSNAKMTTSTLPDASDYDTSVTFDWTNGADEINPVSNNQGTWYTATAADPTSHAATGNRTPVTDAQGADYYLMTQCAIKSLSESGDDLYLDSITVSGTNVSENLDKTLRVAIEVGSTWYYFAPLRSAAPTGGYLCSTATGTTACEVVSSDGAGEFTNTKIGTLAAAVDGQVATLVNIYVYFEGEDPECKSVNVQTLDDMEITIKFASVPTTLT